MLGETLCEFGKYLQCYAECIIKCNEVEAQIGEHKGAYPKLLDVADNITRQIESASLGFLPLLRTPFTRLINYSLLAKRILPFLFCFSFTFFEFLLYRGYLD